MSGLMCGNCGDAVTPEGDELVGSDGDTNCPSALADEGRPHGPAVLDAQVSTALDHLFAAFDLVAELDRDRQFNPIEGTTNE